MHKWCSATVAEWAESLPRLGPNAVRFDPPEAAAELPNDWRGGEVHLIAENHIFSHLRAFRARPMTCIMLDPSHQPVAAVTHVLASPGTLLRSLQKQPLPTHYCALTAHNMHKPLPVLQASLSLSQSVAAPN